MGDSPQREDLLGTKSVNNRHGRLRETRLVENGKRVDNLNCSRMQPTLRLAYLSLKLHRDRGDVAPCPKQERKRMPTKGLHCV